MVDIAVVQADAAKANSFVSKQALWIASHPKTVAWAIVALVVEHVTALVLHFL